MPFNRAPLPVVQLSSSMTSYDEHYQKPTHHKRTRWTAVTDWVPDADSIFRRSSGTCRRLEGRQQKPSTRNTTAADHLVVHRSGWWPAVGPIPAESSTGWADETTEKWPDRNLHSLEILAVCRLELVPEGKIDLWDPRNRYWRIKRYLNKRNPKLFVFYH